MPFLITLEHRLLQAGLLLSSPMIPVLLLVLLRYVFSREGNCLVTFQDSLWLVGLSIVYWIRVPKHAARVNKKMVVVTGRTPLRLVRNSSSRNVSCAYIRSASVHLVQL